MFTRIRSTRIRKAIAPALILVVAVTASVALAAPQEKSLYQRLGGKPAITAVVDEFVSRVAADNRINHYFSADVADPARLATFKMNLVNQICQGTGGPCTYTGKDMKTAHAGMGITDAEFDAIAADLKDALAKLGEGHRQVRGRCAFANPALAVNGEHLRGADDQIGIHLHLDAANAVRAMGRSCCGWLSDRNVHAATPMPSRRSSNCSPALRSVSSMSWSGDQ